MSAAATEVCPWDVDSPLKPKRLLLLARLAVETRAQALAEADREAGDTNWGIGCKAHERFAHAVAKLADSTERSWLRVHRDGLSFVSFIEGVAVRAYHGAADRPHARHVYAAQAESHREAVDPRQLALPFGHEAPAPGERWAWLMAVETDDEGRALRVVFFQANAAGATRYAWVAPVDIDGIAAAQRPGEERHAARATRTSAARAGARRRPVQVALV
ncbi:MAG: hypothetical protein ACLQVI_30200 [Polyangiaceae bacterium]